MNLRTFVMFFSLQFVQYLNITVDYRAIAHKQYVIVALTNLLAPVLSWVMVVNIKNKDGHWLGMVAVALGGAASALLGIWLTRAW